MRFNRLDLNLLVALDALLTERHISRAAEKVHISQSTMSHSLARLREHFEDELLVQVGRKMDLTPRAETLKDPIRDVLVRISSTIDTQPKFDPAQSDREFTLHLSDYTMEMLLPHAMVLAEEQRSRVKFKLLPQEGNPTRSLERGEVDIALLPGDYCTPEHPKEVCFEEKFVCVMWSGSRLAKEALTMDRYLAARHVVMQPTGAAQPSFESSFVQRYGITREIAVSAYGFTPLASLVVGTEMLATVHRRLAERAARHAPLTLQPVPMAMPPVVQCMQWHQYRTNDLGIRWLRKLLREAAVRMDAAPAAGAMRRVSEFAGST